MKISYRWLQDFVECGHVPVEKIADMLTMAGLEVEGEEHFSFAVPETVVVGEILQVESHPNASSLFVCQVNVGSASPSTIVCGAPNTITGIKVPVALPKTTLASGFTVKTAKIRGIVSEGMICAEDELGISDDHSGIIVLSDDAPVGKPVSAEMLSFEEDTVLEIGLTPNRGDCLSHFGVAREIATLLDHPLHTPLIDYVEEGEEITNVASVFIKDPDLCDRYTASLITGVKIGPSPLWLRRRLESVGVRSINNVVDVTNYVMMELGQPLHAFDFDQLDGRKIIVRRAHADEVFTTLDEVERPLDALVLMIADGERSVGIGGVMGGLNSEVSDATTNILLESAHFAPESIRSTSKKLGLTTEASYRFERNVDLLGVDIALRRATKLIAELGGGAVARGIIDVFPKPYAPLTISLRPQRVQKILGVEISLENIQTILSQLGFQVTSQQDAADASQVLLAVKVPSFRPDVTREIDLIEEVGRIYGYENIPTTLPSGEIPPAIENPGREIVGIIRQLLLSHGMNEVVNYSFFDRKSLEALFIADTKPYADVVPLKNPLTVDQDILRTTLIPGLLGNVATNNNRAESLKIFEIGRVFIRSDASQPLPDENVRVSGVFSGIRTSIGWAQKQEEIDFYDLKGILENVFNVLGIVYEFRPCDTIPFFHPGETAGIYAGEQAIGMAGKLHPDVIENFHLDKDRIYIFELFLENLVEKSSLDRVYCSLPKFPAVHRDLAVVVPASIQASEVEAAILEAGKPLLTSIMLFDRYVGPQISAGAVGLTYSLTYRSLERTLTDDEVTSIHHRIIDHLHSRLGVVLRQ